MIAANHDVDGYLCAACPLRAESFRPPPVARAQRKGPTTRPIVPESSSRHHT